SRQVGVGDPRQKRTRKAEEDDDQEDEHSDHPVQLAWRAIASVPEDERHVQERNRDQKVGAPEMHPPYEPSKVRGVLDEDDAGVGRSGVAGTVGNVVEAEQKTSDELDRDEKHRHAAEIAIGPGRVVRNTS